MSMQAPAPPGSHPGPALRRFAPEPHLRAGHQLLPVHRNRTTDLDLLIVRAMITVFVAVVWLVAVAWAAEQLY